MVHGIGVGQRRAALAKGCGKTFSEELISERRFEERDTVSCVKIWKKSILGRVANCHVMKQEQEECAEELPKAECKSKSVREEQSRERRLRPERQRGGLVGTCVVRTGISSYVQWRAARWLIKKVIQSDLCLRKFTGCCKLCRNRGLSGSWHYTSMTWWWLRLGL